MLVAAQVAHHLLVRLAAQVEAVVLELLELQTLAAVAVVQLSHLQHKTMAKMVALELSS
jgi:hypothetical protein